MRAIESMGAASAPRRSTSPVAGSSWRSSEPTATKTRPPATIGSETFVAQSEGSFIWDTQDSETAPVGRPAPSGTELPYPGQALSQSGRSASGSGTTGDVSGTPSPYAEYAQQTVSPAERTTPPAPVSDGSPLTKSCQ